MHGFLFFILFALAAFRLTRILVLDKIGYLIRKPFIEEVDATEEDGTECIYTRKRYDSGFGGWAAELLSCYWCTGVWVSAILYVIFTYLPVIGTPVLWIFGIAGISSIIQCLLEK